jgi:hypothetical protein
MEEWLSYRLGDFLMFSGRTYWRLFELQNAANALLQPVVPAAGGIALLLALRHPPTGLRLLAGILALAWTWAGWSFVWHRYAAINWGVAYAAPLFGLQALLLGYAALGRVGGPPTLPGPRGTAGVALLAWGLLLHPFTPPLFGRTLAGAEIAGLAPDPTAIATLGLALLTPTRPLRLGLVVIPALWLGFSAMTLYLLEAPEMWIPAAALLVAAGGLASGARAAP